MSDVTVEPGDGEPRYADPALDRDPNDAVAEAAGTAPPVPARAEVTDPGDESFVEPYPGARPPHGRGSGG